ncbi:hypothetical protein N9B73_03045 [Verrucomicrobiales bacterium]|nr:hypothetical protein [Verrucomicrobiales bacterium]
MLQQLGIDHEKLNFPFQGLDRKLTGVETAPRDKRYSRVISALKRQTKLRFLH